MAEKEGGVNFEEASRDVLAFLHRRYGFKLWMVTQTEGDDWIVLQTEDHGYAVEEGTVLRWADSFCSRMVQGLGPWVVPRSQDVAAYASAPMGQYVEIGAYIGVPLTNDDGSLFGTLCAIDPDEQQTVGADDLPLIELLAKLLSSLLAADRKAVLLERRAERVRQEALTDPLTGLLNRRGWDQAIDREEARARRFGSHVCVFVVDLDDLKRVNDTHGHAEGDALIMRAANAIKSAVRELDVAARIGGDEFGILAVECDPAGGDSLMERLRTALAVGGVRASIGKAGRAKEGLAHAWDAADRAMYVAKQRTRQSS
jgi:diguanylate cyclase